MGKEAIYLRQAVRQLLPSQALTFPPGKEETQWHRQVLTFPWGRKQFISGRQAGFPGSYFPARHSPSPGEGSILVAQAGTHLPPGEGSSLVASQVGSQGSQASQAAGRPVNSSSPKEGGSLVAFQASQVGSQASQASQVVGRLVTSPSPKEGGSLVASPASQAGAHLSPVGENSSQADQSGSQVTRSGRQHPRHSARQRALQASQGNSTASQAGNAGTWDGNPTLQPPNRLPQGSSPEDPNPKWIINLSSKPLTPAQRSVLAKGSNFVVAPKQSPNLEYITAIEAAYTKLSQQDAEELMAEVNRVLRSPHSPKPNLAKAQNLALRELNKGQGLHSPYCRQGGSYGNYG